MKLMTPHCNDPLMVEEARSNKSIEQKFFKIEH